MELISVVIPTFNRAHTIKRAIGSVLTQTYRNIEVIVVDDGSTDETARIITEAGNNIKYYRKSNGGVASARNFGIKKSNGSLIAFLDSDDEWLPEKLELQIKFLSDHPDFAMILCDTLFVNSKQEIIGRSYRRTHLPDDGDILEDVLISPSLIPSSVLAKKSALVDVGCFDESLQTAEDLDLHLKISLKYKIGLIDRPLLKCMRGHEGLSLLSSSYDDHVYVLERFLSGLRKGISTTIVKQALFKTYLAAANGKCWLKEWRAGISYTRKLSRVARSGDIALVVKMWAKCLKYALLCLTPTGSAKANTVQ